MKKILNITLYQESELLMTCDDIILESSAASTACSFTFKNIQLKKKQDIAPKSEIIVNIYCTGKNESSNNVASFRLVVLEVGEFSKKEWWVSGMVYDLLPDEYIYRQGVIDILKCWEKGISFDWSSLPVNTSLKEDYLYTCFHYSGNNMDIIEKESYQIDFSMIQEVNDFLYVVSDIFFGTRGYMGHSLDTFRERMHVLFQQKGLLKQRKVTFLPAKKNTMAALTEQVAEIFMQNGFLVLTDRCISL